MNNKNIITIIPLSSAVIKSGKSTKDGKTFSWTIYRVVATILPDQRTQTFSSFEDFGGKIDIECKVEVEKSVKVKDGKTYENYMISSPKRNVWQELDAINVRLDKLENRKQDSELDLGVEAPVEDKGEDSSDSSLPF